MFTQEHTQNWEESAKTPWKQTDGQITTTHPPLQQQQQSARYSRNTSKSEPESPRPRIDNSTLPRRGKTILLPSARHVTLTALGGLRLQKKKQRARVYRRNGLGPLLWEIHVHVQAMTDWLDESAGPWRSQILYMYSVISKERKIERKKREW